MLLKHRMLHEQPDDKFLVYRQGVVPAGIGNWLRDLELAYGMFTAEVVVVSVPLVTQFRMVKTDQLVKGKNGSIMHRREPAYGSSPKEAIQLNLRLLADSRP